MTIAGFSWEHWPMLHRGVKVGKKSKFVRNSWYSFERRTLNG